MAMCRTRTSAFLEPPYKVANKHFGASHDRARGRARTILPARIRALTIAVFSALLLTSCTPFVDLFTDLGLSVAPVNPGVKLDLHIGTTTNIDRSVVAPIIQSRLSRDRNLASWFTVVDRVIDANNTLVLEVLNHGIERSSYTSGSRKYGYTTYYQAASSITFSLIDLKTGSIVASARGTGSDSSSDYSRVSDLTAFEYAVSNGLTKLVSLYAGR
jgi:hypothetical protein